MEYAYFACFCHLDTILPFLAWTDFYWCYQFLSPFHLKIHFPLVIQNQLNLQMISYHISLAHDHHLLWFPISNKQSELHEIGMNLYSNYDSPSFYFWYLHSEQLLNRLLMCTQPLIIPQQRTHFKRSILYEVSLFMDSTDLRFTLYKSLRKLLLHKTTQIKVSSTPTYTQLLLE